MGASLIYRSPLLYELMMLGLYGRHYEARYRALAGLVPEGASVLDLCCGPAVLYWRHLRRKAVDYTGLDVNPGFVDRLTRRGVRGLVRDLHADEPLPTADVVVMQASLYHFLPDAAPVVERMRRAALLRAVIAEPIRNLTTSKVPLLSRLAARQTDPGRGAQASRFTEESLDELLHSFPVGPDRTFLIPGGREKVYVFESRAGDGGPPAVPPAG